MHEITYIWVNYFWASLKGNGPEAFIQTIVYAGIAIFLLPRVRRWFVGHFTGLHQRLKKQHAEHLDLIEHNHLVHMDALKAQHEAHIDVLNQHHAEVLAAITPQTPEPEVATPVVPKPRARTRKATA